MNKKNIIGIIFLLVFLISFIFAIHTITNSTSVINEDVESEIIINVDNTDSLETANISVVNITLPSGFVFKANSNSTDAGTHSFSNTSNVLTWSNEGLVMNLTNHDFIFNVTVLTAGTYNISVDTLNETGLYSSNVSIIVNDTTFPEASFVTLVSGGNYSDTIILNVSITDDTPDTVFFNITNISGVQNAIYNATRQGNSDYWNASILTSDFADGLYNITIYANDSNNQLNDSVIIENVRFDNTNPEVTSFSCSPESVYTRDTITCSCSGSDAGSGIAITSYTTNPSTTNRGTFTETCTVSDKAGNTASSTTSYIVKLKGDGSASSSIVKIWTMTYTASEDILKSGYTKSLEIKERIKIKIINEDHYVGIKDITANSAVIEIASDPIEITLEIGEDAKVDVNNDGIYDLYVVLNSITSNKADITVKKVEEKIEEGKEPIETTGEIITSKEEKTPEEIPKKSYKGYWIFGIILAILSWIGYNYIKSKKLKSKKSKKK